jgi:N-acetylglucosamine-6-phosphate deacetylase
VREIIALDVVRAVTIAPEREGAFEAACTFADAGVRVSVGHSAASPEQLSALIDAVCDHQGAAGATHLFNAMGSLAARAPGLAGSVLADGRIFGELILDLHHVAREMFLIATKCLPDRLMLITDAMRASGLPDGTSELGGQPVVVRNGTARLHDGTLAGSVLTMDQAVRNAVRCGVTLASAVQMASRAPARYLGLSDRGALEVGLRADMVVLDAQLDVSQVWVAGVRIA